MKVWSVALVGVLTLVLGGALNAASPASASADEIMLDLALSDAVELEATVTVTELTVDGGDLVVEGSIEGEATILGATAVIDTQPVTVEAETACKGGSGTLTLSTSQLDATLDEGTTATVDPATVTVSATCGKSPTLELVAEPLTATVDGTEIETSECTLTVSSHASTSAGKVICTLKDVICELAELVDDPDATQDEIVEKLDEVLSAVDEAVTL